MQRSCHPHPVPILYYWLTQASMLLQVCLVYDAGELSLIEYGQNTILGSARTEHMSPYLISVCINPSRGNLAAEKKMAYLVDKQTAKVVDLIIGVLLATVSHNAKIDWLVSDASPTAHDNVHPWCGTTSWSSCLRGKVAYHGQSWLQWLKFRNLRSYESCGHMLHKICKIQSATDPGSHAHPVQMLHTLHVIFLLCLVQELNARATHLLFRDKRRQLHLYNIGNQERVTLLPYCSYVQWVPGSDVVVAQSRNTLCVWYSINAPDQQTTINMNGEVEDIQRSRVRAVMLSISLAFCVSLLSHVDIDNASDQQTKFSVKAEVDDKQGSRVSIALLTISLHLPSLQEMNPINPKP